MDDPGNLVVHDAGIGWRNAPGQTTDRPHGSRVWQFNLFHRPVRLRLPGGECRIEAPAGIWFVPGQAQWYRGADGGFTDDWLACSGPLRGLLTRHGVPLGAPFPIGNAPAVEACLHALAREMDERQPFADEAIVDALRQLVRLLGRGLQREAGRDPRTEAILRLRGMVRERCTESWTVARMAAESGLGAHRFAVLYRRSTGSTPLHDLTWFRLRKAQELLKAGSPVAVTARACGFSDPLYFSRVFRRWLGMPPSGVAGR